MNDLFIEKKKHHTSLTIVFIHGIASSSRVFEAPFLSKDLPYNKICFDLPGHGKSAKTNKAEDYTIAQYKRALMSVLPQDGSILLVGNSLGGHLALEVAAEIKQLAGLVIFGTPPLKKPLNAEEAFLPNPVLQTYFTEQLTENQVDEAIKEAAFQQMAKPILKEDFIHCDPKVRSALAAEFAAEMLSDEAETFKQLKAPRYILQGKHDPSVNPAYVEQLCKESKGKAELIWLEECGHYASLEIPSVFTSTLSNICKKLTGIS